ncbi:MAG: LLM class flavin-dependent oxidoreductase [Candidatus Entotheonellia bacterium]
MVKFGLYAAIGDPPHGERLRQCIDEVCAEAQLAEQVGFDAILVGEHHQHRDGFLPSPLIVSTAVAARTQKIRIGTGILLLPLYHPVHVAEDAATLDIISNGRLILGVGMGYQAGDFGAFGIPPSQRVSRMEEGIDIIRGCWTQDTFSYDGKRFRLDNVAVYPKPVQQPHPPIWVGAMADESIRRAAQYGDAWLTGITQPMPNIRRHTQAYKAYAGECQRPARIILMRDAWVAETRQQAQDEYGPEVLTAYKYYWKSDSLSFQDNRSEAEFTIEQMAPDRIILGPPEEVVDQLQRWQEATDAEMVIFRLRQAHSGGPPHEKIMRAIRLFGDKVIPKLS